MKIENNCRTAGADVKTLRPGNPAKGRSVCRGVWRAGGGVRTRMVRLTRSAPFWSRATPAWGVPAPGRGRAAAGGQGFEPCEAALETACSPRSILLAVGCEQVVGHAWRAALRDRHAMRALQPATPSGNSGGV